MHPRNNTNIVFPGTSTDSLPLVNGSFSPTTNPAPVHIFKGQFRTVYVTSNDNLAQLDAHSLNAIHALANGPTVEHEREALATRGTHPSVDTQAVNSEGALYRNDESEVVGPSRLNAFFSRRRRVKSTSSTSKSPVTVSLKIHQHDPPSLPTTRQRILFHYKHDPYFGFTNFSPYPVIYKGKKYPTSEHLFQSFKVIFFKIIHSLRKNTYDPSHSSKAIIPL